MHLAKAAGSHCGLPPREIPWMEAHAFRSQITAIFGELRQVISNLMLNSLDALGEGGRVTLRASTSRNPLDGSSRIQISNHRYLWRTAASDLELDAQQPGCTWRRRQGHTAGFHLAKSPGWKLTHSDLKSPLSLANCGK